MKIKCPHCEKTIDLNAVSATNRGRKIMAILRSLGSHAALVSEYVDLFQTGSIMLDKKRLRLLTEVYDLVQTGEFSLNRRQYRVSQRTVIEGITEVVNRNLSALTNHRYLYSVLAGKADTRADEERRVAEQRKTPLTPTLSPRGEGEKRNGSPQGERVQTEDEETRTVREEALAAIRKIGEKMRIPNAEEGGT